MGEQFLSLRAAIRQARRLANETGECHIVYHNKKRGSGRRCGVVRRSEASQEQLGWAVDYAWPGERREER